MKQVWNKGKIEYKQCKNCGEQIRQWLTYCSQDCYIQAKPRGKLFKKTCDFCGKQFQVRATYKNAKNCSDTCAKKAAGKARSNTNHPLFGTHHSEETRKKISQNLPKRSKEFYQQIGLKGLLKQQHSKEPTSIEKIVYEYLKEQGIVFETQELINGKFLVDTYIPSLNIVIEIDGSYWHSLERVVKKDKAENAYLTKCGYKMIRLTEKEVKNGSFRERMVS